MVLTKRIARQQPHRASSPNSDLQAIDFGYIA